MKKSCGITEQGANVVSSVPTVAVDPSFSLNKQGLLDVLWGLKKFIKWKIIVHGDRLKKKI